MLWRRTDRRRSEPVAAQPASDRELLGVREAAPVRPSVARPSSARSVSQPIMTTCSLAALQQHSLCRPDGPMKTRTPFDLHEVRIEPSPPGTHLLAEVECASAYALAVNPLQLSGSTPPPRTRGRPSWPILGYWLTRVAYAAKLQQFRRRQPAPERARVQSIAAAIFCTPHANSMSCLDMN